jgi:hypothetical protein
MQCNHVKSIQYCVLWTYLESTALLKRAALRVEREMAGRVLLDRSVGWLVCWLVATWMEYWLATWLLASSCVRAHYMYYWVLICAAGKPASTFTLLPPKEISANYSFSTALNQLDQMTRVARIPSAQALSPCHVYTASYIRCISFSSWLTLRSLSCTSFFLFHPTRQRAAGFSRPAGSIDLDRSV